MFTQATEKAKDGKEKRREMFRDGNAEVLGSIQGRET